MKPATAEACRLFHDGIIALAEMEANGIRVDESYLDRAIDSVSGRIAEAKERLMADDVFSAWKGRYGGKTNLTSLVQLAEVLFGEMGIPYPEWAGRTETGRWRTDEEVLAAVNSPFVEDYLKMQKLVKLKSTYLVGLKREVVDGLFHPTFNLHTARTYRSSSGATDRGEGSRDLNFQNLPVRNKDQAEILRRCFIPRDGCVLVENDFSALEFKIAASFWEDPAMVAYASDPTKDVHRDQAADCYLTEACDVSKDMRYCAKNKFVFPVLYGSYYVQCAGNLWDAVGQMKLKTKSGVGVGKVLRRAGIRELGDCKPGRQPRPGTYEAHVRGVEERFMGRFPVFAESKEQWWQKYLQRGWFRLMTGFIVRGVYSKNNLLNYPIQGPGFHCLLWTIIEVLRRLKKEKMKALLVGQIHDCVIGDVPEGELHAYLAIVDDVVRTALRRAWRWIIVPLDIEAEVCPVGGSWFDKAAWERGPSGWAPKRES